MASGKVFSRGRYVLILPTASGCLDLLSLPLRSLSFRDETGLISPAAGENSIMVTLYMYHTHVMRRQEQNKSALTRVQCALLCAYVIESRSEEILGSGSELI